MPLSDNDDSKHPVSVYLSCFKVNTGTPKVIEPIEAPGFDVLSTGADDGPPTLEPAISPPERPEYICTYPGCGTRLISRLGLETHERTVHSSSSRKRSADEDGGCQSSVTAMASLGDEGSVEKKSKMAEDSETVGVAVSGEGLNGEGGSEEPQGDAGGHEGREDDSGPFICPGSNCSVQFKSRADLLTHIRDEHSAVTDDIDNDNGAKIVHCKQEVDN